MPSIAVFTRLRRSAGYLLVAAAVALMILTFPPIMGADREPPETPAPCDVYNVFGFQLGERLLKIRSRYRGAQLHSDGADIVSISIKEGGWRAELYPDSEEFGDPIRAFSVVVPEDAVSGQALRAALRERWGEPSVPIENLSSATELANAKDAAYLGGGLLGGLIHRAILNETQKIARGTLWESRECGIRAEMVEFRVGSEDEEIGYVVKVYPFNEDDFFDASAKQIQTAQQLLDAPFGGEHGRK